ncbi:MAG TPA: hypothetical protein PKH39_16715 [Woeseiaceae bacterium]|nr:hypothetical protein [Woeseiaceae bacterium]
MGAKAAAQENWAIISATDPQQPVAVTDDSYLRMKMKLLILTFLMVAVASCSQLEEIRLHNYSVGQVDVRLDEESNLVDPGESFQFSILSYQGLSIVADGKRLRYDPKYWDLDYVHQTRCGLLSCRVVYIRFDDDHKLRILKPERRNDTIMPQSQPEGFPLVPTAS